MYLDALGLVSQNQAVTTTAASTNVIDLGDVTPAREIGTGEPLGFGLAVDVAADGADGDETYEVQIIQSANADLSAPTVIATFPFSAAQLTAGALFFLAIPPGFPTQRYLALQYVVGGTTPSVTLTAWLTARDLFSVAARAYAKGYED